MQIRGDEGGARYQFPTDGFNGVVRHQLVSGSGNHDGIVYHPTGLIPANTSGNGMGNVLVAHHPDFDGFGMKVVHYRFYLLANHVRRDGMNALHSQRVLGGDGSDDGAGIASECRNGLDIGLDTGTSRRVTTGNGQYDGWRVHKHTSWVLRVNKSMMSNRPRRGSP